MILTDEEKRMRDGAEGAAVAAAMDLLIRYGDALACGRLCDVRNVAGTMTQPSPVKERLVREGGWDKAFAVINLDCDTDIEVPAMRVPTCQLQQGFGPDAQGIAPYPRRNIELQAEAESFYGRRGVNILATCTPYQVGNIPVRGEHCAWMESSAVIYANSVLGARTNCEGTASAGAASLTGKIPCWGNHRDENRYGTHLIDVRTPVDSPRRPARPHPVTLTPSSPSAPLAPLPLADEPQRCDIEAVITASMSHRVGAQGPEDPIGHAAATTAAPPVTPATGWVLLECAGIGTDKWAGYTSANQLDNSQEGWDTGLETNWAVTSAGTLDETAVMHKLENLDINTPGSV